MSWSQLFFSFRGRVGRALFWLVQIAAGVLVGLLVCINHMAGDTGREMFTVLDVVIGVVMLALIWPLLAVNVKRWHDLDMAGWWVLLSLVPLLGWPVTLIANGFLPGTQGPNRYGEPF